MAEQTTNTGKSTTEYAVAQSGKAWSIIAMILGAVVAIVPSLIPTGDSTSKAAIIMGAAVSVAAIAQRTLTDLGYIKSRAEVKSASSSSSQKTPTE